MQGGWLLLGPLDWMCYVNKQVRVKTGDDEEHRGWLLTVDPVSASVVLVNFGEVGVASVRVVMGHAVEEVEVLQEADEEMMERLSTAFLPQQTRQFRPDELRRRRERAWRWLEKNRVLVEEDSDGEALKVAGVLTIMAPYTAEDCRSSNEIILDRIQKLLEINPENLEDQPGHT